MNALAEAIPLVVLRPRQLSSALPDEAFDKLHMITATSPTTGSRISLSVQGWARVQGAGQHGSVVKLLTQTGAITLDGRALSFTESTASFLQDGARVLSSSSWREEPGSQAGPPGQLVSPFVGLLR